MSYSERAFFEGDHCHHCGTREEHQRLARINRQSHDLLARHHRNRQSGHQHQIDEQQNTPTATSVVRLAAFPFHHHSGTTGAGGHHPAGYGAPLRAASRQIRPTAAQPRSAHAV